MKTTINTMIGFDRKRRESSMSIRRTALVTPLLALLLIAFGCGPATTQQVVKDDTQDEMPKLTQAQIEEKKRKEEEERRKKELEESLKVRKVVVAETPEFIPGVEVDAQKEFRTGVISVYQAPPDFQTAATSFEDAIEKDKNFMEAYFNLGMVYERTGQGEKALTIYQEALDANPESGSAKAYIGKVYLAKAKEAYAADDAATGRELEKKAKKLFDEVIIKNPDNVSANNSLALYWLMKAQRERDKARRLDSIQTAEDYVQTVLTLQPHNTVGLNSRGLIYLLKGELEIAKWVFENKVLTLDKFSTEAYNNLGLTYYRLNRVPNAVVNFAKAIQVNSENVEARMNLAAILLNFLNYGAAFEQYKYVLSSQPENTEAIIGLGSALIGMQEFDKGFEMYRKAYKLNSNHIDLLMRIARLYQTQLVNFDKAIEAYQAYITEAQKVGVDTKEAEKGLEQSKMMAAQMKKMEEEMRLAEEAAKKAEAEMKKKADKLEKSMRKVESKANDYIKKLEELAQNDKGKAKKAKALIKELKTFEPQMKGIREYVQMTMVDEAVTLFEPVEKKFKEVEAKAVELLGIKKKKKIESEEDKKAMEEKKAESAGETGEKVEEPKAEEPKAEEPAE